jgi:hypothetical protein
MTGATIVIDDASASDNILSVKERVFAANRQLPVRRQRLVYRPGPRGMDALADEETLGGAGVAQDGTALIDVLLADLTAAEAKELGEQVWWLPPSDIMSVHVLLAVCHSIPAPCLSAVSLRATPFTLFCQRKRDQLLNAARDGRSADALRLLSDGAGIECKDRVRLHCLFCRYFVRYGMILGEC